MLTLPLVSISLNVKLDSFSEYSQVLCNHFQSSLLGNFLMTSRKKKGKNPRTPKRAGAGRQVHVHTAVGKLAADRVNHRKSLPPHFFHKAFQNTLAVMFLITSTTNCFTPMNSLKVTFITRDSDPVISMLFPSLWHWAGKLPSCVMLELSQRQATYLIPSKNTLLLGYFKTVINIPVLWATAM